MMQFPLSSAFLALPLEGEAKARFTALQEALADYVDILRFQNPATPHLTLYYWKELLEIEWKPVEAHFQRIAAKTRPFTLPILGTETFGQRGEDRVLFLAPAFSPELAEVKKNCPWPNAQPFHPHITLARIGHVQRFAVHKKKILKLLGDAAFEMSCDRLRFYARVGGAGQVPLEEYGFQQSGYLA